VIGRRDLFALAGLAGLAAVATSGCGSGSGTGGGPGAMELVSSDLPRTPAAPAAGVNAAGAVSSFTADLYARLAAQAKGNLVCSPYSVAVALGMTAQGARGRTAEQLLKVLHTPDAATLAAGLSALDVALAARAGTVRDPHGGKDLVLELAGVNSLWGQRGLTWERPFLDALARAFGTGMRVVDYQLAPEAARRAINAWVSQQTHTRIPELIAQGVIDATTALTLVNALYLKAPWQEPFEKAATRPAPFTRADGSTVTADLMSGAVAAGYASGPGWVAADLPYAGGELAMAVVVPDAGRFAAVEQALDGGRLAALLAGFRPEDVQVGLPRWTTRTAATLNEALIALGMPLAFTGRADFSGMTRQVPLEIAAVVHQGFIAVDEAGTEAAAATAVVVDVKSARQPSALSVVADRPFLYLIHDRPTGTPLFVGRVLDPTAA
jgi:serine protease inhibitor